MTGWSEYFGTEKYERHPYLSKEGAEFLVSKGVSIVGLDALNIDSTISEVWDAHGILLSNEVLIVENLNNLSSIDPSKNYCFSFLPLKLDDTDGSPIRAAAIELSAI
jgi:kynurenine formamidase